VEERLFDAFVTTKAGGLGLGLSICRSVIEAHGGSIGYRRDGANGRTRFTFQLPLERA
jgi:two-component system sensor kinase FixL